MSDKPAPASPRSEAFNRVREAARLAVSMPRRESGIGEYHPSSNAAAVLQLALNVTLAGSAVLENGDADRARTLAGAIEILMAHAITYNIGQCAIAGETQGGDCCRAAYPHHSEECPNRRTADAISWTDRTGLVWQVWADGKSWAGDSEVDLARPVVDRIFELQGLVDSANRADQALADELAEEARDIEERE